MEEKITKVIIVDDEKLIRDGFKANLKKNSNIQLLASLSGNEELFHYLRDSANLKPDVIFLDMYFPGAPTGGMQIAENLKKRYGDEIKIIMISSRLNDPDLSTDIIKENSRIMNDCINAGVSGFVSKTNNSMNMAVNHIAEGEKYVFDGPALKTIVNGFSKYLKQNHFTELKQQMEKFNLNEIDIQHINYMAEGKSVKEIAVLLATGTKRKKDYSQQLINARQAEIARKLQIDNKSTYIVIKAFKEGLILFDKMQPKNVEITEC